jgi:hypothetical protein
MHGSACARRATRRVAATTTAAAGARGIASRRTAGTWRIAACARPTGRTTIKDGASTLHAARAFCTRSRRCRAGRRWGSRIHRTRPGLGHDDAADGSRWKLGDGRSNSLSCGRSLAYRCRGRQRRGRCCGDGNSRWLYSHDRRRRNAGGNSRTRHGGNCRRLNNHRTSRRLGRNGWRRNDLRCLTRLRNDAARCRALSGGMDRRGRGGRRRSTDGRGLRLRRRRSSHGGFRLRGRRWSDFGSGRSDTDRRRDYNRTRRWSSSCGSARRCCGSFLPLLDCAQNVSGL